MHSTNLKKSLFVLLGVTMMTTPIKANEINISDVNVEYRKLEHNYSTEKNTMEYIVIHDTAGKADGANADSVYNYFNQKGTNASSNYIVDDSKILQIVEDKYQSWHCGDGGETTEIQNSNSIGIEMCVNADGDFNKTFDNTVKLTKYLMNKYDIPVNHVIMHGDASGKECSERLMSNNSKLWKQFKEEIGGKFDDYYTPIDKEGYIVNISKASFRQGPGIASYQLDMIPSGETVNVLSKHINGWYKVEYKGTQGFIYKDYIKINENSSNKTEEKIKENKSNTDAKLKTKEVVLRSEPSIQSDMEKTITKSGKIEVVKEENNWVEIKTKDSSGWILKSQVDLAENHSLKDNVSLFKKPDVLSKSVTNLNKGQFISILKTKGIWCKVECNNKKGWIPAYYIN